MRILLVLAVVLAVFGYANRDRLAHWAAKDLGRPVRGIVLDARSGEPIAGAVVTSTNTTRSLLFPRTWQDETRTNARGEFTVQGSSEDEYEGSLIEATAEGYEAGSASARFRERMVIPLRPAGG